MYDSEIKGGKEMIYGGKSKVVNRLLPMSTTGYEG